MTTLTKFMAGTEHETVTLEPNGERCIEYQACRECGDGDQPHIASWTHPTPGCGYSSTVIFKVCLNCGNADLPREKIGL